MGISGGPYIVRDSGLVLELDAADRNSYPGSGTTWRDLSGTDNSNNGTLTNGPTFSNTNNGNIVFNGSTQYVAFTDIGLIPTTGLTVSVWFKTTVADRWLIDKAAGATINGYSLRGTSTSDIQFSVNTITIGGGVIVTGGNWIQAVGTWTPSTSIIFYLAGVQVSSTTTSIPASITNPSSNLQVARRSTNVDYWNGSVAQVLIYTRALSATEILQNYNAQKSRFGL
jgi:hypothetical protein